MTDYRYVVYQAGVSHGRAEAAAEIERLRKALREVAALTGGGTIHEIARAALRGEEA